MARRAGKKVLWAEDSAQDQILIQAALEDLTDAPEVTFAGDGVHLLAALRKARPDLVVLDLKMPRLGGLETLRALRAEPAWADLPVCVFSAGDQPAEVAACKKLGALDVVQKPVDFRRFAAAVHQIVSRAAS